MKQSEAKVTTAMARRYLGQLCKHFAHKIPVVMIPEDKPTSGAITFSFGVCRLQATENELVMQAEAADAEALAQTEDVIKRHLERFAFRDTPEIAWQSL